MELFHQIFGTDAETMTWWQMSARAVLVVVYAIVLFRLAARRLFGRDAVLDIIVLVILGSTLSRALTGNAPLLPALVAVAALVVLHSALAALAARVDWFGRLAKGSAERIITAGKIDRQRTRRANIGEGDLMEELRLHGVPDPATVEAAYIERNGRISVIER